MSNDVFVSYHHDDNSHVERLVSALQREAGFEKQGFWWDRKIQPGTMWNVEVDTKLRSSPCLIVLWSKRSVESAWVKYEAACAHGRDALISITIDDCDPPKPFDQFQVAKLNRWNGTASDQEFRKVVNRIQSRLAIFKQNGDRRGIGIVGASGTGKTTLLTDMKSYYNTNKNVPIHFVEGVSRRVIRDGFPLGQAAHPDSYVVLMQRHIKELLSAIDVGSLFMSERTLLDQYCYAMVNKSLPRPSVRDYFIELMHYAWKLERRHYLFYVFLPIESGTKGKQADGDVEYQRMINDEFLRLLESSGVDFHQIAGNPWARVQTLAGLINPYNQHVTEAISCE